MYHLPKEGKYSQDVKLSMVAIALKSAKVFGDGEEGISESAVKKYFERQIKALEVKLAISKEGANLSSLDSKSLSEDEQLYYTMIKEREQKQIEKEAKTEKEKIRNQQMLGHERDIMTLSGNSIKATSSKDSHEDTPTDKHTIPQPPTKPTVVDFRSAFVRSMEAETALARQKLEADIELARQKAAMDLKEREENKRSCVEKRSSTAGDDVCDDCSNEEIKCLKYLFACTLIAQS